MSEEQYKSSVYIKRSFVGNDTIIELKGQEPTSDLLEMANKQFEKMKVKDRGE